MPTSSTDSRLSLAEVNRLRHRSHGVIQSCLTRAGLLVSAAAELDAALQSAIATHDVDDLQSLVGVARQLAALLDDGSAVGR